MASIARTTKGTNSSIRGCKVGESDDSLSPLCDVNFDVVCFLRVSYLSRSDHLEEWGLDYQNHVGHDRTFDRFPAGHSDKL